MFVYLECKNKWIKALDTRVTEQTVHAGSVPSELRVYLAPPGENRCLGRSDIKNII